MRNNSINDKCNLRRYFISPNKINSLIDIYLGYRSSKILFCIINILLLTIAVNNSYKYKNKDLIKLISIFVILLIDYLSVLAFGTVNTSITRQFEIS